MQGGIICAIKVVLIPIFLGSSLVQGSNTLSPSPSRPLLGFKLQTVRLVDIVLFPACANSV